MKKKSPILILPILLIFLLTIISIQAQTSITNLQENPEDFTIELDQEKGIPKSWVKYQESADSLTKQNSTFLKKEWTKIFAKNKILSPIFFYTDKFFSFFNPLWKYSFGTEFEWSFAFFITISLWIIVTIFIYFPAKEIFKNTIFGLITGIIVASITGAFGVIPAIVNLLNSQITNIFYLTIYAIIAILLIILYNRLFKKLKKEDKKEKLERADAKRLSAGEVAEKFLGN
jgi:hypothetical protein